jgi:diguanylate cyclase (GGDEF)-like protein
MDVPAALRRRLEPLTRFVALPVALLDRVRRGFLLLTLAWAGVTIARLAFQEPDLSQGLAGCAAVLTLVLVQVHAYRRNAVTRLVALAEVLVIVAGTALDGPNEWTTGYLVGAVFLRSSLGGSARTTVWGIVTWTAAIMAGEVAANAVGRPTVPPLTWTDLPQVLVTVSLLAAPARIVTHFVGRYDEAVARERALLSAASALVATGSPDEVGAVAVRAAAALVTPHGRVRWLATDTGSPAGVLDDGPLAWDGDITVVDAARLEECRAALGLLPDTAWLAAAAVGTAEHRHLLLIEGPEPVETSVLDALGALASTLTTGLRAVETTTHLRRQALEDPLTGLANRARFEQRLADAVSTAQAAGPHAALLLVDLDGFKAVNDRMGHAAGDAVLVAVAERLRSCTRAGDLVARLGGDEFVLLVEHTGEGLPGLADRVTLALAAPIVVEGVTAPVSGSVGAVLVTPGLDGAELLRRADRAMYQAKAAGKATFVVHPPESGPRPTPAPPTGVAAG